MSNGIKPFTGLVLTDYLRIRLHESSGQNIAWEGKLDGSAVSGSIDVLAAPTWTADHYVKAPASNTTVGTVFNDATVEALTAIPDTGGLAVFWVHKYSAKNGGSKTSQLFQWGARGVGIGGYAFGYFDGVNLNIQASLMPKDGAAEVTANVNVTASTGVAVPVAMYFKSGYIAVAVNGNWSSAQTATTSGAARTKSDGLPTNQKMSLLSGHTSFSPATLNNRMNQEISDDFSQAEIMFVPDPDGTIETSMTILARQHALYWRFLPIGLRNT